MGYPEDPPVLEVRGLKKYFPVRRGFLQRVMGWIKAVDGIHFRIQKGQTLGLVGESGCGKSTTGRLVLKLLEPDDGEVLFGGVDITPLSPSEMKPFRRKMQIVFQDPYGSLNPRMTIGQTIEEGLRIQKIKRGEVRKKRVEELLRMVGLPENAADRYPHEFSGGQRQRIGIARGLSVEPRVLICDEPVSALDVSVQSQILNLLKGLQEDLGLSYLFIAHDLHVVRYISHEVAVMYLGQIMEHAPAEVLYENPLHPYTRALLTSMPVADPGASWTWEPLPGDVPSAFEPPPGCKFQGRCPVVEEACRRQEIPFYLVGPSHLVRCWKATDRSPSAIVRSDG